MNHRPDTIAAIATARGRAALAIIRLSGPDALPIADRCFEGATRLSDAPTHTVHFGRIKGDEGRRLDEVVATIFRAPAGPTGEDVVEISCHGGDVAPQLVLNALIAAGARPAEPGEFTQRAFLNGKMDLAQAEAVADLIHARTSLAHRVAMHHLSGDYSARLSEARTQLLDLCALVELELDFSEEDVAFADRERLETLIRELSELLDTLLGSYQLGALVRDGVRVVIAGRPNAGKSTLLNALVGSERAIVSPIPGTTRDTIEAEVELGGLAFRFVDTAGLREASDVIEAEGVRRADAEGESADVLLYVFDASLGLDDAEAEWLTRFVSQNPDRPLILIANKVDLLDDQNLPENVLPLSASAAREHPETLDTLKDLLVEAVGVDQSAMEDAPVVVSARHRMHLGNARQALQRASAGLQSGLTGDLLSLDLRAALDEIGAVTGEMTSDDVLGAIFSRFCIGK